MRRQQIHGARIAALSQTVAAAAAIVGAVGVGDNGKPGVAHLKIVGLGTGCARQKGTRMGQSFGVQYLQRSLHTGIATIKGVVIGCGNQIDPGIQQCVHILIRSVKAQVGAAVSGCLSRQRGFQISYYVIRLTKQ